jgi:hypothetical protein
MRHYWHVCLALRWPARAGVIIVDDLRAGEWPFADPPNSAVFTTAAVLEGGLPVLLACHDDDGSWQFLCGTTFEIQAARLISLREALARDGGLALLADLPPGWMARRLTPADPWIRSPQPGSGT